MQLGLKRVIWATRLLPLIFLICLVNIPRPSAPTSVVPAYDQIDNIIVIFLENWSYDGLLGHMGRGLKYASNLTKTQIDLSGNPYTFLPVSNETKLPKELPNGPFELNAYVNPEDRTSIDLIHAFYNQQFQINGGKMNRFAARGNAKALTMSHYDTSQTYLGELARNYTVFDNWFHAGFGGSFFNHQWLITPFPPVFPNAPDAIRFPSDPLLNESLISVDAPSEPPVTHDGYAVNTILPSSIPRNMAVPLNFLLPLQNHTTIGDRMTEGGVSWRWYSGGWDDAVAGKPGKDFQFHHQPFVYFSKYDVGQPGRKNLADYNDFIYDLEQGYLPTVTFYKPYGEFNMHPQYSSATGTSEAHLKEVIGKIQSSKYWAKAAVVILFDENGGRWDHVSPPSVDRWGPGVRIPALFISPFGKKGYVDSTYHDSTSVMKFIEDKFNLPSIGERDAQQLSLKNAFLDPSATPSIPTSTSLSINIITCHSVILIVTLLSSCLFLL